MQGVVYVDILVLTNAIIAYFLLKCVAFLAGRMQKTWRLCVASFLAGFTALTLLLPPLAFWFVALLKLACAVGIVLTAFPPGGWRVFGKTLFWYVLCNALLGGVVAATVFYGGAALEFRNLSLYLYISPIVLVVCILVMYAAIQLCGLLFGKPKPKQQLGFSLWITEASPPAEGTALLDTGMHLRDPLSGKDASLFSLPALHAQLPAETAAVLQAYFTNGTLMEHTPPIHLMTVKTAGGTHLLPAFCAARMLLHTAPHSTDLSAPLVVFTGETLADGGYQGILGADWQQSTHAHTKQHKKRSDTI